MEFILNFLIMIFSLIFIILLIFILSKLYQSNFKKISQKNHIQIIEKVPLSKETYIIALRLGKEGKIIISSKNKVETIKTLTDIEINEIIKSKESKMDIDFLENINISKIFKAGKEKSNEKIMD